MLVLDSKTVAIIELTLEGELMKFNILKCTCTQKVEQNQFNNCNKKSVQQVGSYQINIKYSIINTQNQNNPDTQQHKYK